MLLAGLTDSMPISRVECAPVATDSRLELSLIPRFDLRCDGSPVVLGRAPEQLIAFLALNPGPARREQVCATLWPAADGPHAAGGLRTALWRLRTVGVVRSSRTHIWLSRELVVDVHQVNDLVRRSLESTPTGRALAREAESLLAVAGGILTDYTADWVIEEREWFRQTWLQEMDRIGELLIDAGECSLAIRLALATARAEPLRESSHRLLVKAHANQGNLVEAMRAYRRYAVRLHRELNLQPSRLMRDLMACFLRESAVCEQP